MVWNYEIRRRSHRDVNATIHHHGISLDPLQAAFIYRSKVFRGVFMFLATGQPGNPWNQPHYLPEWRDGQRLRTSSCLHAACKDAGRQRKRPIVSVREPDERKTYREIMVMGSESLLELVHHVLFRSMSPMQLTFLSPCLRVLERDPSGRYVAIAIFTPGAWVMISMPVNSLFKSEHGLSCGQMSSLSVILLQESGQQASFVSFMSPICLRTHRETRETLCV